MSKYESIKVELKDKDVIKAALKNLGYPVEEHAVAQALFGYQGDQREEVAHLIVRRKHLGRLSNDLGFLKGDNGAYNLVVSEYDKEAHKHTIEALQQQYGVLKFKKQIHMMGGVVSSQKTDEKGRIRIRATLP